MAEQFAVYSEAADEVLLAQTLTMQNSAMAMPYSTKLLAGGASYTLPSAGNADPLAVDKLFFLDVIRSNVTTTNITVVLPETPKNGQFLCVRNGPGAAVGPLVIAAFDGDDYVNGSSSCTLRAYQQAVLLQAVETSTPGHWNWRIVAEYGGGDTNTQRYVVQWGALNDSALDADGSRIVPFAQFGGTTDSSLALPTGQESYLFCPETPSVARLLLRLNIAGWSAGTVTITLRDVALGTAYVTIVLTSADNNVLKTYTAADLGFASLAATAVCQVDLAGMTTSGTFGSLSLKAHLYYFGDF
jgi:hypothetical protein